MCTSKNAPKLPALRHNPAVALTIDTEVHPPKILLIRGQLGEQEAVLSDEELVEASVARLPNDHPLSVELRSPLRCLP